MYVNLTRSDKDCDQTLTYEWKNTELRGMTNMLEYKSGVTNLVVTTDRIKPSSVIDQAVKDNCRIVSVLWIHLSMHLNTLLPYELFAPKDYKLNELNSEKQHVPNTQENIAVEPYGAVDQKVEEHKVTEDVANPELTMKQRFKQTRHDEYIKLIKKIISLHFESQVSSNCLTSFSTKTVKRNMINIKLKNSRPSKNINNTKIASLQSGKDSLKTRSQK